MSILTELQKNLVSKGGTPEAGDTIASTFKKLAAVEVDLPAVTTDDNGKVLTVVEGAWDAATPAAHNSQQ